MSKRFKVFCLSVLRNWLLRAWLV